MFVLGSHLCDLPLSQLRGIAELPVAKGQLCSSTTIGASDTKAGAEGTIFSSLFVASGHRGTSEDGMLR